LTGILHPLTAARITPTGIHRVDAPHRQIDLPRPRMTAQTSSPE
jgi:hypothetical protein